MSRKLVPLSSAGRHARVARWFLPHREIFGATYQHIPFALR
ncbi:hypothetical protein ACU686_21710 [Yinghuangia aomiensis]